MDFSLANIDFDSLTMVKAKLSEQVSRVVQEKRVLGITLNGKPKVVLIPYEEFLAIVEQLQAKGPSRYISLEKWEKERPARKAIAAGIKNLFGDKGLSRKGQKAYKRNAFKKSR